MDTFIVWITSAQVKSLINNMFEQGALFSFLGMGVLITFRFFRFPDLTAEGSYPLGGAVVAILIVKGLDPYLSTVVAVLAGATAGMVTALVHTKLKINNIISGIVIMTAIYSINLRVMGRANTPLLSSPSVFSRIVQIGEPLGLHVKATSLTNIIFLIVILLVLSFLLFSFLRTDLGLAVRATGENEVMIRSLGVNTDNTKILGLAISNGFIALSGALVAQNHGFADIGMGIGVLVAGAAAVLIGEAIFGDRTAGWWILAVVVGMIIYRFLAALALRVGFTPTDLKLVTAVLLLIALSVPRLRVRVSN